MATVAGVPTSISSEALAHVTALGLQREFDQMLEHTKRSVPGLQAIDVNLAHDPEGEDDPRVIIDAFMFHRELDYDPTEDDWGRWLVSTFPPGVFRHFVLLTAYGPPDER